MAKKRFYALPEESDPVMAPWDDTLVLYEPSAIITSDYNPDSAASDPEKPSDIHIQMADGSEHTIKLPALDLYADEGTPDAEYLENFHRRIDACRIRDGNRVVRLTPAAVDRGRRRGAREAHHESASTSEVERSFLLRGVRRIRRVP